MQTVVCRAEPQNLSVVPRQPLILVPVRDVKIAAMSSMVVLQHVIRLRNLACKRTSCFREGGSRDERRQPWRFTKRPN
ncbi:hypothetical protein Y032_0262g579 [Ancylostoma ceylanicum]|uniref:Uncharacterized protein n=1 Tax=Ancylostoma ceylanicum TaxID=53326 RepID=A0A016SB15_9BILA|nr:hypothetical protein Y032_0262g579 [Ancylostoma ceylanicum]